MVRCPDCRLQMPAEARFCPRCGRALNAPEPERPTLPLPGERRPVTVMFVDVVGSTAIAERLDPEDWGDLLHVVFAELMPVVQLYEGSIAQLLGDGFLCFFGAPLAHEDDPQRAIRAALDLVDTTRRLAQQVKIEQGIELAIRVGLNTGLVVVGDVGGEAKHEYLAVGDAVNLAARMQSSAQPMTVLISEQTHRLVAGVFDCLDMGEIHVKGKSAPVRAWQVVAPVGPTTTGTVTGGHRRRSGGAMVGRDRELAVLSDVIARREDAGPAAVIIRGEPGVGKSRLLREWRERSRQVDDGGPPFRWVVAGCLAYGRQMANHAVVAVLLELVGSSFDEDEHSRDEALRRTCQRLFAELWPEPYASLAHMCALPLGSDAAAALDGLDAQALRTAHVRSVGRLVDRLAKEASLVVVLEDVHWIDQASADLLAQSMAGTGEAGPTWVFTMRPVSEASSDAVLQAVRAMPAGRVREVDLAPLSDDESQRLVDQLIAGAGWSASRIELVRQRAEGNPLFAEELVRMLTERWSSEGVAMEESEREIPATLHGLLLSRIDGLPADLRETVRVAAVVGRRFPARVLAEAMSA